MRLLTGEKNNMLTELSLLKENMKYGQSITYTGSWTYDLQSSCIFLTDEVYNILECNKDIYNGNLVEFYSFVHPEDLETVKKAKDKCMYGEEYELEYRIIVRDQKIKFVHEKTQAIYDENNNFVKMLGVIQDITYRKVIENNLKAMGDTLQIAERVSGLGCFKYDIQKMSCTVLKKCTEY